MADILLSVRKSFNKVVVGASRLFYSFDKRINGVVKSKVFKVPNFDADVNFQIFHPKDYTQKSYPIIVYFHGGGWIEYDKTIYNTLCKRLSKMGNIVVNVDYPLAPKYKMHKLLEGCIDIINFAVDVAKEKFNASDKVILSGDSAGAQISALFGGLQTENKVNLVFEGKTLPKISALLLFYGVYNFETVERTNFPSIKLMLNAVFNKSNTYEEYSLYSPINYVGNNYPQTFIASGKRDKLHKLQTEEFIQKLQDNGVTFKSIIFKKDNIGGSHGFMAFDDLKTNKDTLEGVQQFLNCISGE